MRRLSGFAVVAIAALAFQRSDGRFKTSFVVVIVEHFRTNPRYWLICDAAPPEAGMSQSPRPSGARL